MKKTVIILSVLALVLGGCRQTTKKQIVTTDIQDTIIIKQKNVLNVFEASYQSKSYSYYWLAGKDTVDFALNVVKYKTDSVLSLDVSHKNPILFTTALEKIEECFPLIKEDFDVSKFESINFKVPVFYLDLAKNLSNEYEQEFGRKNISQERLNQFLLKSNLTLQLNDFLSPLNKKVKRYGFEKFHLIDKENYNEYLPNVDFAEYPEFTLNAHIGISVWLENK